MLIIVGVIPLMAGSIAIAMAGLLMDAGIRGLLLLADPSRRG